MSPALARASFEPETVSASQARRFVADTLESWGRDGVAHTASLLVTELAANAVLHAGTTFQVVIQEMPERVRVEVHDANAVLPARRRYSTTAATGRGLVLVEAMSADWGAEPTAVGKLVWFELDPSTITEDVIPAFDIEEFDLGELGPPPGTGPGRGGSSEEPSVRRSSATVEDVETGAGRRP